MSAPTTVRLLARALARRGVRHAFGMPGGETLPLLEALETEGVRFVLVRHEGSAGFMADASAQLTGAPGVCVSTLGPGATNLVTGLAGALLDRAPVVAITGQVQAWRATVYTHQVLDQRALMAPVCKRSYSLTAAEAWREIPLALRQLELGRRGPVHLDIPMDVATALQPGEWVDRFEPAPALPTPAALAAAAEALTAARRPVVLVGLGELSDAVVGPLRRLVEALGAPTMAAYKAKGLLDEHHPLCAGAFGLSTTVDRVQQDLLAGADLVLTVGLDPVELRPQWLPGWPPHLPLIAVDRAPPEDLVAPVAHALVGEVPAILDALADGALADGARASAWTAEEVAAHNRRWLALLEEDGEAMGPAAAIRAVQAALPDEAVVALDVGAHRITAAHAWRCRKPNTLLQSNGLSSMGYGLPAAIAAKLARPDVPAVALTGDAGLWMMVGELGTVADLGLDLVVVYLADRSLALIELKQQRAGLERRGVGFTNPDVSHLAAAFGGHGVRVTDPEGLRTAVAEGVRAGGLRLIEAVIDPRHYAAQV